MIDRGEKKIEYRDLSPHWKRRLWDNLPKEVRFQRAYSKNPPTMTFQVVALDIGPADPAISPPEAAGKEFYRIHLGKRTSLK